MLNLRLYFSHIFSNLVMAVCYKCCYWYGTITEKLQTPHQAHFLHVVAGLDFITLETNNSLLCILLYK